MQEKQSPPKLIFREKMGEILSGLKKKLEQRQSRTKNKKLEEFASEPHSLNAPSYEEKELPSLEQLSQQILEREDILEVLDQWTEKVSNEMR
ncbi:MAG: hypothetical protein WAU07_05475, partial [Microgenomates group bacterium]